MRFEVEVGDRVIARGVIDRKDLSGITGTVIGIDDFVIYIEWDEYVDGHNCDGRGRAGHCWNAGHDSDDFDHLELFDDYVGVNECTYDEIMELINGEGVGR